MNNPVLIGGGSVTGVIVFVKALINLVRAMQWFALTEEQWNAWSSFFETTIPIAAVWIVALWVSRKTTSLADPKDKDGVELTRPGDTPAIGKLETLQSEAILINKEQTRGLE